MSAELHLQVENPGPVFAYEVVEAGGPQSYVDRITADHGAKYVGLFRMLVESREGHPVEPLAFEEEVGLQRVEVDPVVIVRVVQPNDRAEVVGNSGRLRDKGEAGERRIFDRRSNI